MATDPETDPEGEASLLLALTVCGWGDTSVDTIDLQTDHSPESASDANVRSPGNLAQPIDAAYRVMITIVNHGRHAGHNLRRLER